MLVKSDAINFNDAAFRWLKAGTVLHRVWGGSAYDTGSYWSPAPPPNTEAEWRGAEAVAESWNAGSNQATLTILVDAVVGGWFGSVAAQPAQDTAGLYLAGYELPGGGQQVKVIFPKGWTFKDKVTADLVIADVGPTAWASTASPRTAAPTVRPATGALATTPYSALDVALAELSQLLRDNLGDLDETQAATREAQALLIDRHRGQFEADVVDDGRLDPGEVMHHLRGLRSLRRYVEAAPDEVSVTRALDQVAASSHALL